MSTPNPRAFALTAAAMVGFAANSLLCRAALGAGAMDAASFTAIRVSSGALVLWALLALRREPGARRVRGSWAGAAALLLYALAFSFAYLRLGAGLGALLLFGAVQLTMMLAGLRAGERPSPRQWLGLGAAGTGLVVLVFPALRPPDPLAALLMLCAGVAWGAYSLLGRSGGEPLANTAGNFARAAPVALAISALLIPFARIDARGVGLAVASGALASGVGYSLWYAALPALSRTQAAIAQLSAPLIAAAGGVVLLGESLTPRLLLAAAAIGLGVTAGVIEPASGAAAAAAAEPRDPPRRVAGGPRRP